MSCRPGSWPSTSSMRHSSGHKRMPEIASPTPPPVHSRIEHVFPTLTPAQIGRVAAHGHVRPIRRGEVLVEAGEQVVPFFVVIADQGGIVQLYGCILSRDHVHIPGYVS